MGKYFSLETAFDTPETGSAYPAVESYKNYNFNASNSVNNLDTNTIPGFTPSVRFKLARKAKLTDVLKQITISARGLLVSKKFKDYLTRKNIIPHVCFPATIEDIDSIIHNYYWIHFTWEESIKYLDFENSKFKIKRVSRDLGEINIKNYKDLVLKQSELGFIKMIHNYETTMINPGYDLFLHPLNGTIYISEELKNQMTSLKFSGISIKEINNLKVVESEV